VLRPTSGRYIRLVKPFDLDAPLADVCKELLEVRGKGITMLIRYKGAEISEAATGPDSIFQHDLQIYLRHLVRRRIELRVLVHC
jgi:hypothetical protein